MTAIADSPTSALRLLLARLQSIIAPLRSGKLYLACGSGDFKAISSLGGRSDLLDTVRNGHPVGSLSEVVQLPATAGRETHIVSVPIVADSILIGLIILERSERGFDASDTEFLLRIAEQLSRLLQSDTPAWRAAPGDRRAPTAAVLPASRSLARGTKPQLSNRRAIDRRIAKRPRLTSNGLPVYGRRAADRRLGVDMSLARNVQRRFLPALPSFIPTGPDAAGIQLAVEYHPAYEVGGDFYGFLRTGQHRFIGIIGDVSGKGVSAALVMSRREADFRRLAPKAQTPGALLSQLNNLMAAEEHDAMFTTALCVQIDTEQRSLAIANAGHVPIVHRSANGELCFRGIEASAPLGIIADEDYTTEQLSYDVGDIIVLMTDGVSDALDPTSSVDRDSQVLSAIAATALNVEYMVEEVLQAAIDASRAIDDLTLLGLQLP